MGKFKVWQVGENALLKTAESNVGLEKNLESWIEADPTMMPGVLEITCRQMTVEGGWLDLLALTLWEDMWLLKLRRDHYFRTLSPRVFIMHHKLTNTSTRPWNLRSTIIFLKIIRT